MNKVFMIDFFISPYEGSVPHGASSSLEKAVVYCQNCIKEGVADHVEDPTRSRDGGLGITEYVIDDLADIGESLKYRFFNDSGVLLREQ